MSNFANSVTCATRLASFDLSDENINGYSVKRRL